jgi:hypothetical protein
MAGSPSLSKYDMTTTFRPFKACKLLSRVLGSNGQLPLSLTLSTRTQSLLLRSKRVSTQSLYLSSTSEYIKHGSKYSLSSLYCHYLTLSRYVREIRDAPKQSKFRKMPTVGDALIFILYNGNYTDMGKDGLSIPPPSGSQSPKKCMFLLVVFISTLTSAQHSKTYLAPQH